MSVTKMQWTSKCSDPRLPNSSVTIKVPWMHRTPTYAIRTYIYWKYEKIYILISWITYSPLQIVPPPPLWKINAENLIYSIFQLSTLTPASTHPWQMFTRLTTFFVFTLQFEHIQLPTTDPLPTLMQLTIICSRRMTCVCTCDENWSLG